MNKVLIVVDSTCDLSKELIEANDLRIIPLSVNFSEEIYYDGKDITTEKLYQLVAEKGVLPHTAAATPGEFMVLFEDLLDEGYDIVYTGIGAKLSKSFENALMISKEYDHNRIVVVDSANLSTGIGLLVMKACKWRDEGKDIHEIARLMREEVPYVRSQFVVETMEYLHKGGRCSGVAKFFGTMLGIRPLIAVRDGSLGVAAKPRGKMKVALEKMLEMLINEGDNVDDSCIFITHSIAPESCDYLLQRVKEIRPNANIYVTEAGCVISTHCGQGTIGVLYTIKH